LGDIAVDNPTVTIAPGRQRPSLTATLENTLIGVRGNGTGGSPTRPKSDCVPIEITMPRRRTPSACSAREASEIFPYDLLEDVRIEREVGHHLLQLGVFAAQ
jgi:hypothetical protein